MTKPALIIIDMQKCMAAIPASKRNNTDAELHISRLLSAWRQAGHPVVHVRHMSLQPNSPFAPGQPGVEFQNEFLPAAAEQVFEKNVPDAFTHTGLERWLRVRDISQLVVVGVSTNNSVESTVRTAGNLGFRVTVVSDATFAFEKLDFNGNLRSADDVHAMSLANLDGEYADVVSTESLLTKP